MINWPEMLHHAEDWAAGFWAGAVERSGLEVLISLSRSRSRCYKRPVP
jgi:hypothetical protein